MANNMLRELWDEPRVDNPPPRGPRDWILAALIPPVAAIEIVLRDDVAWPAASFLMCVLIAAATLWRRTHPLQSVVVTFGFFISLDAAFALSGQTGEFGLYTAIAVLLLPYSLFRWASGRQAAAGLTVMLAASVAGSVNNYSGVGDVVGGVLVLLFATLLGAEVRHLRSARRRELEEAKLREREQLARELHDTVAHHVSAIAVQAQAGQAVAETRPEAPAEVLRVIEEQASRTLDEMRSIVAALRKDDDSVDYRPQLGVGELTLLADSVGSSALTPTPVVIDVCPDLGDLSPAVDAAIYRIAQEAVTNAHRHATAATFVRVTVEADPSAVYVTIRDDGRSAVSSSGHAGYGLIGMAERVSLLGGTFEAGPEPDRGWLVHSRLPRVELRNA